jgi:hypothetical protein
MGSVSAEQMGKATGAYGVFQFLGGAAGIALGTTAFALLGDHASQTGFVVGFKGAAWTFAAMAFAGSLFAGLLVPGKQAGSNVIPPAEGHVGPQLAQTALKGAFFRRSLRKASYGRR